LAIGWNLIRTPGLHPYSLYHVKYHGIFNDHRVSEPQFNVSSEGKRPVESEM